MTEMFQLPMSSISTRMLIVNINITGDNSTHKRENTFSINKKKYVWTDNLQYGHQASYTKYTQIHKINK